MATGRENTGRNNKYFDEQFIVIQDNSNGINVTINMECKNYRYVLDAMRQQNPDGFWNAVGEMRILQLRNGVILKEGPQPPAKNP